MRLLFDADQGQLRPLEELKLFDPSIRWILGDRSKPLGAARYAFLTCKEAQAAAAGGVRPGKQNNLRISSFEHSWLTWAKLTANISSFLLTK